MFKSIASTKQGQSTTTTSENLSLLKNKLTSEGLASGDLKLYSDAEAINNNFINVEVYKKLLLQEGREPKLKCKLVYIRLEKASTLSQFFATRIGKLIGSNIYGLLHPCILIGNYLLHWFNDSLVHFTEFVSKKPFIAVDIGELDLKQANDVEKIKNVCKLVVKYNIERKYDQFNCNCHHFTKDIQETIGMTTTIKGQLGQFLKKLVIGVNPEKEFENPFTKQKVIFSTHKQLDDYVVVLIKEHPEFENDAKYKNDWLLLKAFDRGFYMGKFSEDQKSPLERNSERLEACCPSNTCPFNNPYEATLVDTKRTAEEEEY